MSGNQDDGIDLVSGGNTLEGNPIGTTATGSAPLGNAGAGIGDFLAGPNTIGSTASGAGNVISGNGSGIEIYGSKGDIIQGNRVGTNAAGTAALGNYLGIGVDYTAGPNTIGGTASGAGNLISGNTGTGVDISNASGNVVAGNLIGTDVTGAAPLGNGCNGVSLSNQSSNNVIGGTAPGSGNVIGGSSYDGVEIPPGPNDYTACPVIQNATTAQVGGTACHGCTVEVYGSAAEADDQGHGDGKTYLGSATADANGSWSLALSAGQVSSGQLVTATATVPSTPGKTSEFAANVIVG